MNYLLPEFLGLPEEPASSIQNLLIDGNSNLSPAGAMCSTLLQLRTHVETEKLERTTLKQLVQRLQRDFALLQPHIEALDQKTTNQSPSLTSLENRIKIPEKRLSIETDRHNARLNSNFNYLQWAIKSASSNTVIAVLFCGR